MKSLDLNAYGVKEMNRQEMVETDGGLGGLLILGAIAVVALVASSCGSKGSGSNNEANTVTITNSPNATVVINGDTTKGK